MAKKKLKQHPTNMEWCKGCSICMHFFSIKILGVDARQSCLPMYETLLDKICEPIVFNICMLGAVVGMTDVMNPDSMAKILKVSVP